MDTQRWTCTPRTIGQWLLGTTMLSKYLVWLGERKRQNGSYPVEKVRYEEVRVLRNRLMCKACLPPGALVMFVFGLLTRTISVPVALPQPQSLLMSTSLVTTEGHATALGLGCHLGHDRVQGPWWPCLGQWCGLSLGSVFLSISHVTTHIVFVLPNIYLSMTCSWPAGVYEGNGPLELSPQNVYDFGQQKDIWEEFQWGSSLVGTRS